MAVWTAAAQTAQVSGVIRDEFNEPVTGANIIIKGTYNGTTTDLDGGFTLEMSKPGKVTLLISYLGYKPMDLEVDTGPGENKDLGTIKLKPGAEQLAMVTITAGAFEASDEKRQTLLKPLDIVTTAGATADIAGALNTLPGTQTVGEEGKLFVRGGAAYETQTFIDGMLVQKPYNSNVPNLPSRGRFSPFLFSGTAFSTGGYSAEYGQALSSALVLNTHDLAPKTQTSLGLTTVGLDLSHQERWENSSLAVTGNLTDLSPYNAVIRQNIDWIRPFNSQTGQLIFRQKLSEDGILKVHGDFSNSRLKLNYLNIDDPGNPDNVTLDNNYFFVNSTIREIVNDNWTINGGIAYNYNHDQTLVNTLTLKTTDQMAILRLNASRFLGDGFKIKFGTEYHDQSFRQSIVDEQVLNRRNQYNVRYLAGFAEADLNLGARLFLRLGERLENSDYLNDLTLATRASMAYKLSPHAQVSAAFGQFYQLPESEFMAYSNRLSNEKALHYILNYQYTQDNITFRIEGYYKQYDQLIKYTGDYRYHPETLDNSGNGFARGVDIFYRDRKSIRNADFWVSYSFLDTKRDYRYFPEAAIPVFASKHNLSVVYKHWIDKIDTQLGFTYSFASGRPYDDPATPAINDQRTPDYHDLSLNLSHITQLWGNYTVLYLSCSNILGFRKIFGYRYSSQPDAEGIYYRVPIEPTAPRFALIGLFVYFDHNKKQ